VVTSDAFGPRPGFGYVRTLSRHEVLPLLRDRLLRLDPESRHDRFNGYLDDGFIDRYAARCAGDGILVVAYMENGLRSPSASKPAYGVAASAACCSGG